MITKWILTTLATTTILLSSQVATSADTNPISKAEAVLEKKIEAAESFLQKF
jgi:hypothetical protein